jgi:hypothetical protein
MFGQRHARPDSDGDDEGSSMHYIFKADESAPDQETPAGSVTADGDALKLIAPRSWVAGAKALGESSLDLHDGLEVSEAEIDTVPADLLKDLFDR